MDTASPRRNNVVMLLFPHKEMLSLLSALSSYSTRKLTSDVRSTKNCVLNDYPVPSLFHLAVSQRDQSFRGVAVVIQTFSEVKLVAD